MSLEPQIEYFADHASALPIVVGWFEKEWPSHYGFGGPDDAQSDLLTYLHKDTLPLGLLAICDDSPCGFIGLKMGIPGKRKETSLVSRVISGYGGRQQRVRSALRGYRAILTYSAPHGRSLSNIVCYGNRSLFWRGAQHEIPICMFA